MPRPLKIFINPPQNFKFLTMYATLQKLKPCLGGFSSIASNSSSFKCEQDLLDELPQRYNLFSYYFNLLKMTPFDSALITHTHCLSLKTNFISNISIRTSFITAYARISDLDSSLLLFNEANNDRDIISWNAMISACVLNSMFEMSIHMFQEMVNGFGTFDSTTVVIVLSALSRTHNLKYGLVLHCLSLKEGFIFDLYVSNALIDLYAKCRKLSLSESVFEEMEVKDATSWNSIMNGCLYNNYPIKAAFLYRKICNSNVRPDQVSLSGVISACSNSEALSEFGKSVHTCVVKLGYEGIDRSSVDNSLISFYSSHEYIEAAEKAFRGISIKDEISYNSMIKCYMDNGLIDDGVRLLHEMQSTSEVNLDSITLLTITPLCADYKLLLEGKSIHAFVLRRYMSNLSVTNSLLEMYMKCGELNYTEQFFSSLQIKDIVTWNTMISGYSTIDLFKFESQILFHDLLQENHECTIETLLGILPSCNCPQDLSFGKAIHCWGIKYGFCDTVIATNAIMLMYINSGDLKSSSMILNTTLPMSDIVTWNTIISGFVKNEKYKDALRFYHYMREILCLDPDPITIVSVLSASGNLDLILYGKSLHCFVLKSPTGLDVRVKNALITMYFRCGDTNSAELVFKTEGERNLCSWVSMINGFSQNKNGENAIKYFRCMKESSFEPNEISIVGLLCACTCLGNLRLGREVHGYITRFELCNDAFISSALVDMYSKCGRLDIATRVFEKTQEKSIASWNSMISAYGCHGHGRKALELFSKMLDTDAKITKSTFISILSACSHNGLIDEGLKYYKEMTKEYGIQKSIEHHVLVVGMLGKAGMIHEAYNFVKEIGNDAEPDVWGTLLSASNDHGDLEMGKLIWDHLYKLEFENSGYYVTLSNLYACHGKWSHAQHIRSMIRGRRLVKTPGISSVNFVGKFMSP